MEGTTGTAARRYVALAATREPFLNRARQCSRLTIPGLIPPDGHTDHSKLPTPYQSVGSRGVNNLANKLLLSLLPPNRPFFRMVLGTKERQELDAQPDLKSAVEQALGKYERMVQEDVDGSGDRTKVFEGFKHLLVAGNVLLVMLPDAFRVIHLTSYVVRRDPVGNLMELVIKERIAFDALPEGTKAKLIGQLSRETKEVDVYTYLWRKGDKYHVHQETGGVRVDDSTGTYRLDNCPYIPLRFSVVAGEDYGRSFVEEYLGDLTSLESLSKAMVEGSLAAAKVLILVRPNGTTRLKTVAEADNLAVREGNADDITVMQLDKFADFRVAKEMAAEITQRLAQAFLLHTAIQRDAERVTAEEVRYMAAELEDALGGFYSLMSQEFQLPYARRKIALNRDLPKLPRGAAKPAIVTGIEALGRGDDLNRLDFLLNGIAERFGPAAVAAEVNVGEYIRRRATAVGIDVEGLLKTPEQKAQEQQQAALAQTAQNIAPELVKQAGGSLKQPQG